MKPASGQVRTLRGYYVYPRPLLGAVAERETQTALLLTSYVLRSGQNTVAGKSPE